jgi:hypothetical protein
MLTPFTFGDLPSGTEFVNRRAEIARLKNNFRALTNTILISPRRWGKTSLVYHVANSLESRKHRFCHINMQRVNTEAGFYDMLVKEVIRATASKAHDALQLLQDLLSRAKPALKVGTGAAGFEINLDVADIERSTDDIIELPQRLAKRKGLKLTLCIDEFQNLMDFAEPLRFQRLLRASWQHHDAVGYCLYGSKKHMMYEIFESPDMPFFKFGDILFLDKIGAKHWIPFIVQSFARTNKQITQELAAQITSMMDNHPYYVQYFSHVVWNKTSRQVTADILDAAMREIFNQHVIHFDRIMDGLTYRQVNFLRALIRGESQISSKEVINSYDLGTSSTVTSLKNALIQKEIIDVDPSGLYFQDPPFRLWLERVYFG